MNRCLRCGKELKKGNFGPVCAKKVRKELEIDMFHSEQPNSVFSATKRIAYDFLLNNFPFDEFQKFRYKYPLPGIKEIEKELQTIFNNLKKQRNEKSL